MKDRDNLYMYKLSCTCTTLVNVLTSEESVRRWKGSFEDLMNDENERETRTDELETVKREVGKIREMRECLKRVSVKIHSHPGHGSPGVSSEGNWTVS